MKKLFLSICFFCFVFCSLAQSKLQSPSDFLGYELGDRFTRHHRMVEYFKAVDEAMPNMQVVQYGETEKTNGKK